jgi:hypothetical protein
MIYQNNKMTETEKRNQEWLNSLPKIEREKLLSKWKEESAFDNPLTWGEICIATLIVSALIFPLILSIRGNFREALWAFCICVLALYYFDT